MFSATNLTAIQYILLADAFATPLYRFLNLWDTFQKYSAAKIFHTQSELNANWQGAQWTLAERYSDCLKTVYTGLFYAVPLPSGLFIVAIAMLTTYSVDKYSLFRLWRRKAAIDGSLGTISKNFFIFSVLSHIASSYYFFYLWPFCDPLNMCVYSFSPSSDPCSSWHLSISLECRPRPTGDQETIVSIYVVSLYVIFALCVLGVCYKGYRKLFKLFVGYTKEIGDASSTRWRDVKGADIFLPNITHPALASPILFTDVDLLPAAYSPTMKSNGWEEVIDARVPFPSSPISELC
jgi:hypothetical protein